MKRVEGRTLRELLDERGSHVTDLLWRQRLLALFADICETVAFAHTRGIIHRDLKPDNVLVDDRDAVTVIDWGLAKRVGRSRSSSSGAARTMLGDVLGSPGYMAPEQASGASLEAGPPADVFSLGAILYEILTGANPFPGATPRESMLAAIHRDPPDLRKQGRGLWFSHSLVAVCRKALEKEPERRYASAGDLARDLRALRAGRPASAARPSWLERIRWRAKRRPISFAVWTAGLLIAVLGLLFFVGQVETEAEIAETAYERIARRDLQIAEVGDQLRDVDRRRATAADARESARLDLERSELEMKRLLHQLDAIYISREIAHLRFLRPDPRILDSMKARLFEALRSALDMGEAGIAKALADTVRARAGERGSLTRSMSAEERARLQRLVEEADLAFELAAADQDD